MQSARCYSLAGLSLSISLHRNAVQEKFPEILLIPGHGLDRRDMRLSSTNDIEQRRPAMLNLLAAFHCAAHLAVNMRATFAVSLLVIWIVSDQLARSSMMTNSVVLFV